MNSVYLRLLLACLLLFGNIPESAGQSPQYFLSDNRKVDIKDLDLQMKRILDNSGIPALSLAVIENNRVVYTNTWGYKDAAHQHAAGKNTMFEACSLSKMFLLDVVYQLADEGVLDLDKPLYQYQPEPRLEHDPRYKKITARMILSHTSGMENWQGMNDEYVLEIVKDPGAAFTYSGEGYHYLARVIASILKMPYKEYVQLRVLHPLQLQHTKLYYTPADSTGDFALGHNEFAATLDKWATSEPWPASSVNISAGDYAAFIIRLFDGKHLSANSLHQMLDTAILLNQQASGRYYIGNGFFEIITAQDTIVNFSGNNTGFKADMLYSPRQKRGYVFFANNDLGILPDETINKLTTRLDAAVYFSGSYFARTACMSEIVNTLRKNGRQTMLQTAQSMLASKEKAQFLESMLPDIYHYDPRAGEALADLLFKNNPAYANGYAILGAACIDLHQDCAKAGAYLSKAKALNQTAINVDDYLKKCKEYLLNKNL
ncbi:CubicO group peptidase, beta-lactamase class C family [Chitinophaga costaii]|uniref:CubicO group peptidase, beta-lactamase class C family n=1 Tax=Chitinophaga costaii TaxID=1335309 RepID=A0A1C3YTF3_9BACT|nr:serine hydrolase domain-containing protein [Chitinophaga costaii]PUZ30098.1 hypothetical protein DCM91_01075 [Chitinophaga costaii]SCB73339.1 CubicO group peptidase, beta-lactamase class C family [Chitinophaga costaii]